eukprot:28658_1
MNSNQYKDNISVHQNGDSDLNSSTLANDSQFYAVINIAKSHVHSSYGNRRNSFMTRSRSNLNTSTLLTSMQRRSIHCRANNDDYNDDYKVDYKECQFASGHENKNNKCYFLGPDRPNNKCQYYSEERKEPVRHISLLNPSEGKEYFGDVAAEASEMEEYNQKKESRPSKHQRSLSLNAHQKAPETRHGRLKRSKSVPISAQHHSPHSQDSPLPPRFGSKWMEFVANLGNPNINELSIPGTHDSGAFHAIGFRAEYGYCQDSNIEEQLKMGIRYFDIRVEPKPDTLYIRH